MPSVEAGPRVARSSTWTPRVIIVVAIVLVILSLSFVLVSAGHAGYGRMMGGDAGWGWMWGVGALMMVIPLVIVVLLIVFLAHSANPPAVTLPSNPAVDPLTEARVRYARGELTSEQFHQVLSDLQRT